MRERDRIIFWVVALVGMCVAYMVIAWALVRYTDLCPPPWQRLEGAEVCISPK